MDDNCIVTVEWSQARDMEDLANWGNLFVPKIRVDIHVTYERWSLCKFGLNFNLFPFLLTM